MYINLEKKLTDSGWEFPVVSVSVSKRIESEDSSRDGLNEEGLEVLFESDKSVVMSHVCPELSCGYQDWSVDNNPPFGLIWIGVNLSADDTVGEDKGEYEESSKFFIACPGDAYWLILLFDVDKGVLGGSFSFCVSNESMFHNGMLIHEHVVILSNFAGRYTEIVDQFCNERKRMISEVHHKCNKKNLWQQLAMCSLRHEYKKLFTMKYYLIWQLFFGWAILR